MSSGGRQERTVWSCPDASEVRTQTLASLASLESLKMGLAWDDTKSVGDGLLRDRVSQRQRVHLMMCER